MAENVFKYSIHLKFDKLTEFTSQSITKQDFIFTADILCICGIKNGPASAHCPNQNPKTLQSVAPVQPSLLRRIHNIQRTSGVSAELFFSFIRGVKASL